MRAREAAIALWVAAALITACASPATSPSADPSVQSQEPSPAMSTSPSAEANPDRFGFSEEMPTVTVVSTTTDGGLSVTDLIFEEPGVQPTEAYLIAPASGEPGPGIVWFHWVEYGSPTSNRTEFLDEATTLAAHGVTSLLVQGNMPWNEAPESIAHDVPAIEAEVRMLHSAVDLLATRPEVNPEHLAAVGHDFGGMYSSLLFGVDLHLDGLVLMAPTARWADWFYRYWPIEDPEADYSAALADLDPVTWLPLAAPRPVLLQFAANDAYIPEAVANEISAAAGSSGETRTYDTGHEMNEDARADRDAWLADLLGFQAPED